MLPVILQQEVFRGIDQAVDARRLAMSDPLTGLLNRRALFEMMERVGNDHVSRIYVIYIDLDNFKRLNDTRGHQAGDDALREAAEVLRSVTRATDLCARFGGEEFVVVVNCNVHDEAAEIAERLRETLESHLVSYGVTASIGVAVRDEGMGIDELIQLGDQQMYSAKTSGKNRVCLAWSDAPPAAA